MAYQDEEDRAYEQAINQGILEEGNLDQENEFRDDFYFLMEDPITGEVYDHFPSAEEVGRENWDEWFDFLDEYDLWDEFRKDWENYEKT